MAIFLRPRRGVYVFLGEINTYEPVEPNLYLKSPLNFEHALGFLSI